MKIGDIVIGISIGPFIFSNDFSAKITAIPSEFRVRVKVITGSFTLVEYPESKEKSTGYLSKNMPTDNFILINKHQRRRTSFLK